MNAPPREARDDVSRPPAKEAMPPPRDSSLPSSTPAAPVREPQHSDPTAELEYGRDGTVPSRTDNIGSNSSASGLPADTSASRPGASPMTGSGPVQSSSIVLPGSFPEQTPTEPPPAAEYFKESSQRPDASASAPAPIPALRDSPSGTSAHAPNAAGQSYDQPLPTNTNFVASPTPERLAALGVPTDQSKGNTGPASRQGREDNREPASSTMAGAGAGAGAGALGALGAHEYSQGRSETRQPETGQPKVMQPEARPSEGTPITSPPYQQPGSERSMTQRNPPSRFEQMAPVRSQEGKDPVSDQNSGKYHDEGDMRHESDDKDKKKGGILGKLRRGKDSKGEDEDFGDPRESSSPGDGHRSGKDANQGPNKLTKEPPPGLTSGAPNTSSQVDYPIKEDGYPGARTIGGGHTAPSLPQDQHQWSGYGAGVGQSMPPTEQSRNAEYSSDTQQYTDSKMRGASQSQQYTSGRDDGRGPTHGSGQTPDYLSKDTTSSRGAGGNAPISPESDSKRYDGDGYGKDSAGRDDEGNEGGHHSKVDKLLGKLHLKKDHDNHGDDQGVAR